MIPVNATAVIPFEKSLQGYPPRNLRIYYHKFDYIIITIILA